MFAKHLLNWSLLAPTLLLVGCVGGSLLAVDIPPSEVTPLLPGLEPAETQPSPNSTGDAKADESPTPLPTEPPSLPTLLPTDEAVAGEEGTDCTGADPHPHATTLAERLDVSYEEIMGWFCQGFGFGEIELAYNLSRETSVPVAALFAMKLSGLGWGEIAKEVGVKPGGGPPAGHPGGGPPDDHPGGGPPDDKPGGGPPDGHPGGGPPDDRGHNDK